MERSISAADANRNFSTLLREVRDGDSFLVTSHGKPVARIVPAHQRATSAAAGRDLLVQRLAAQPVTDIGRWSRDELYEDR